MHINAKTQTFHCATRWLSPSQKSEQLFKKKKIIFSKTTKQNHKWCHMIHVIVAILTTIGLGFLRQVSSSKNTKKKGHTKKETFIHPASHHNRCYGEANFHKAPKLIEADQICFTSLHSFKMAISLPISRAFTVPHSPGSGWELARLSWMKHSNSPVLPWNPLISL